MNQENIPHILLIEDDQFFRELVARKLREKNCMVTERESVETARETLQEGQFSVVCFDIVVLGIAGFKKLSELMTSDHLRNATVLLLTDKDIEAEVAAWAPHATLAHLVKSEATPEEIVALILSLAASHGVAPLDFLHP